MAVELGALQRPPEVQVKRETRKQGDRRACARRNAGSFYKEKSYSLYVGQGQRQESHGQLGWNVNNLHFIVLS